MKRRSMILLLMLLITFVLVVTILFWPRVYAYLIDPLARISWLVLRMFLIVDQKVYWILLIFAGFILTALLIPGRRESYNVAYDRNVQLLDDRITYWQKLLDSAQHDPDALENLQRRLNEIQEDVYLLVDNKEPDRINLSPAEIRPKIPEKIMNRLLPYRKQRDEPVWMQRIDEMFTAIEKALEMENDRSTGLDQRE